MVSRYAPPLNDCNRKERRGQDGGRFYKYFFSRKSRSKNYKNIHTLQYPYNLIIVTLSPFFSMCVVVDNEEDILLRIRICAHRCEHTHTHTHTHTTTNYRDNHCAYTLALWLLLHKKCSTLMLEYLIRYMFLRLSPFATITNMIITAGLSPTFPSFSRS